ncbi:MAG: hypothetical protein Q4C71_05365 [Microbacteriaceae bacterium]|nr:hypothetical protein [Microbacteriaceae bacterium]
MAEKTVVKRRGLRYTITDGLNSKSGKNISWRSIFAGVITFIALNILFSLIGVAIGLGGLNLRSDNPGAGVGTGLIIWGIISLLISLFAAGFVAGLAANRAGFLHGFITWAATLITVVILASSAVSGVFGALGSFLGGAGNMVSQIAKPLGHAAGKAGEKAFEFASDKISFDANSAGANVRQALEKSSIKQLHPDYLQKQLDELIAEAQEAGKNVVVEGKDPGDAVKGLQESAKKRVETITKNIDKKTLANELTIHAGMSQEDANKTADNLVKGYEDATKKVEEQVKKLQEEADKAFKQAVKVADETAKNVAKTAIWLFVSLILAAIVTTTSGVLGSRFGSKITADEV